jgi:hypothetical protein
MKIYFGIIVSICFLSVVHPSYSQTNNLNTVSIKKDSITTAWFLEEVEKQSGYKLYYNPSDLDTTRFTIAFDQLPADSALRSVLTQKGFFVSTDNKLNFFILKGKPIVTTLSTFQPENQKSPSSLMFEEDPADIKENDKNKQQRTLLENKLFVIGERESKNTSGSGIITGYIKDAKTGEPVVGASVMVTKLKRGTSTDQFGYYTLSLPKGQHILGIQSIGMADTKRQVMIAGDGKLNIEMQIQVTTLKNVVVSSQKLSNIKGTQMGVQKMDIKTIKLVPVAFGEADLLRVMVTLPGVKTVGEASTGLNVRGGSADQNLILFNEATIYNPSHFFGLFSAFNPEVVKDVQLYKSSIPAKFGGRLSSVLDITSREGNKKKITGTAGIGVLTTRLDIEGPLIKDKSSFIIGGRTTYANWLLKKLPKEYANSKASFNDLNLNISHEINKKNSLYLTGYLSNDKFNLNSDTFFTYGNRNISLKYKHIFNNKLNALITTGYDRYQYNISSDNNPVNAYKLAFDINQLNLKVHFNYYISPKHTLEYGLNSILYKLHPGNYQPVGKESLVTNDTVQQEQGLESALYLSDRWSITPKFSIDGGLRYSMFNYLGAQNVNTYAPGLPKTEDNITGTVSYKKNEFINTYNGPEYRVGIRYAFNDSFSMKAGFNTQRQYVHTLSNTTAMAPTDIRKLSDPNIKPQYGQQVSFGLYKNLFSNSMELSAEVYYKWIKDFLDYKSGAVLVMNHHVETEVFSTRGKAYGIELMLKRLTGKLNGWISYTYSRTLLKQDDPLAGEIINKGDWYPANYDKPHDVTFVGNYRFTHRFSLSLNSTYSTGRPITLPVGSFYYAGSLRTLYGDRNANRIPDYFRTDVSINIDGNHKLTQWLHSIWTIGVYNITGRKNPYSVYFVSENGVVNGYKLSIFGSAIPYVNLNIRF